MKRSWVFSVISAAAAMALVLTMASCEKEMPGRLDGQYPSSGAESSEAAQDSSSGESQTSSESVSPKDVREYAAPPFRSGSYVMESSSVNEQYYYSGQSVVSFTRISQIYTYGIRLTVKKNGAMTAVYTFRRIRTGYETSDGAETTDTDDTSGRDDDNAVYYDLIGQKFTVNISKDYKITVKGIDAIHKKYPYTADIVNNDNMKEVAADLFYQIGDTVSQGSSWKLTQVGMTNTYTVSGIKEGSAFIHIKGGRPELPEPFTTEDGMLYTYTGSEPLSGSLVMSMDDRMMQEQSSYQENSGKVDYKGKQYTFKVSAASVCNIVAG